MYNLLYIYTHTLLVQEWDSWSMINRSSQPRGTLSKLGGVRIFVFFSVQMVTQERSSGISVLSNKLPSFEIPGLVPRVDIFPNKGGSDNSEARILGKMILKLTRKCSSKQPSKFKESPHWRDAQRRRDELSAADTTLQGTEEGSGWVLTVSWPFFCIFLIHCVPLHFLWCFVSFMNQALNSNYILNAIYSARISWWEYLIIPAHISNVDEWPMLNGKFRKTQSCRFCHPKIPCVKVIFDFNVFLIAGQFWERTWKILMCLYISQSNKIDKETLFSPKP